MTKLLCPICGSPASRSVAGGSQRECSACYHRYDTIRPVRKRRRRRKLVDSTQAIGPTQHQEDET